MIVQDKENQLYYYGAVQFHTDGKKMSLAKYPGVTMERGSFTLSLLPVAMKNKIGIHDGESKSFYDFDAPELLEYIYHYYLGSKLVNHNDWIVTDSQGKSKVYVPDEFREQFEAPKEVTKNEQ